MRLKDKVKTIQLRKQGFSYKEIMERISNLSKSTISGWVKYIELTPEQQKLLIKRAKSKMDEGRIKAGIIHRENRIKRTNKIIKEAKKEVPKLIKNPLFLIGLIFYWSEGSQKTNTFSFINSDPVVIKLMIKWIEKICKIPKDKIRLRLYIHKVYAHENCEKFWSEQTGIPIEKFSKTIYKPTPHTIKRNPHYKGCLRIDCGGVELFRRFLGWRKGALKYLKLE